MCVVSQPICMIAGNDFYFDLQLLKNDDVTPVDLTFTSATMQLLESDDSISATITMSGGVTDPEQGLMRFTLTDVETQSLLPIAEGNIKTTYVADVQITYQDSTKEVILRVDASVEQGRIRI